MSEEIRKNKLGNLGARYGRSIKERIRKIYSKASKSATCPSCKHDRVRRVDSSIFACGKCGYKFAGGAYYPETMTGSVVRKAVAQKENMLKLGQEELDRLKRAALAKEAEPVIEAVQAPLEKEVEAPKPKKAKKVQASEGEEKEVKAEKKEKKKKKTEEE